MEYRNVKTGTVIDVCSVLSGPDWEAILPPAPAEETEPLEEEMLAPKKTTPAKKPVAKKAGSKNGAKVRKPQ